MRRVRQFYIRRISLNDYTKKGVYIECSRRKYFIDIKIRDTDNE